jgi:HlyD family secretion protein
MKKFVIIGIIIIVIVAGGLFLVGRSARQQQSKFYESLETAILERGTLITEIGATGTVHSNQSALLFWQTTGEVGQVFVQTGDPISSGELLASLQESSLPAYIILAQAELVNTEKALDNLIHSQTQQALVLKAVEDAQQALEDAQNPELAQANALAALADAQQTLETVKEQYAILVAPISQITIDQAYANMLLAEKALNDIQDQADRFERKLNQDPSTYMPWESKRMFRKILDGLQIQLSQSQSKYDNAVAKYNNLFEPPDPNDVAIAETALLAAQAQLQGRQRQLEIAMEGAQPGEMAVLEAQLADAQREWESVKNGPKPEDIAILETQIAATQATINQMEIAAPFDGVVTLVESLVGDQVSPGTTAFRIDDLSPLLVDLFVSETDINQIQEGQPVSIAFDALPGREYNGLVNQVALVGTEMLGITEFRVSVELLDADSDVKPGMTSEVNITVHQVEDVLMVPNQAMRVVNGQRVVYVLMDTPPGGEGLSGNSGGAPLFSASPLPSLVPVPITLGAISNTFSEIIAGDLQVGDQVVLNPPSELEIGFIPSGGGLFAGQRAP